MPSGIGLLQEKLNRNALGFIRKERLEGSREVSEGKDQKKKLKTALAVQGLS